MEMKESLETRRKSLRSVVKSVSNTYLEMLIQTYDLLFSCLIMERICSIYSKSSVNHSSTGSLSNSSVSHSKELVSISHLHQEIILLKE